MSELLGLDEPLTRGSVVASDAFFPFRDGIDVIASRIAAIIQPGGSIRDEEVIAAANEDWIGNGLYRNPQFAALIKDPVL